MRIRIRLRPVDFRDRWYMWHVSLLKNGYLLTCKFLTNITKAQGYMKDRYSSRKKKLNVSG